MFNVPTKFQGRCPYYFLKFYRRSKIVLNQLVAKNERILFL